jgi:hypothetical protein
MPKLIEHHKDGFSRHLSQKGLSVYGLSRTSGVAEKTLRKMTQGHGPVRLDSVRKLAVSMGLEVPAVVKMLELDGVVVVGLHV